MSGSRRNIETGIERKNISNCVKVTTLAHHLNLNSIPTKTKPLMLSKSECFNMHCIDTIVYYDSSWQGNLFISIMVKIEFEVT